jgi:hypothetical protein
MTLDSEKEAARKLENEGAIRPPEKKVRRIVERDWDREEREAEEFGGEY